MDQNPTSIDVTKKNELEKDLTNTLFEAAKAEKITLEGMQPIAAEILPEFDKLTSQAEVLAFLEKISIKWDLFKPLLLKYNAPVQNEKEKQVIDKLSNYISGMK